jgi:hypothetical protein
VPTATPAAVPEAEAEVVVAAGAVVAGAVVAGAVLTGAVLTGVVVAVLALTRHARVIASRRITLTASASIRNAS